MTKRTSKEFQFVIVTCARWESDQIVEWLIYHRSIGFDHVFLYCNDDDPTELYEKIIPFGPEFVTFTHFPFIGQQYHMHRHFLMNHKDRTEWFAFMDIDEFLFLGELRDIGRFVEGLPSDWDSVYFNWRKFGPSGHAERPSGSVLLNYTYRGEHVDPHTKTFTRSASISTELLGPYTRYTIHHKWPAEVFGHLNTRNVLGEPMKVYWESFPNSALRYLERPGVSDALTYAPCIFHFFLKSMGDFRRRTERSTSGDFGGQAAWLQVWDAGKAEELVASFGRIRDDRLCRYWETLLGRARELSVVPSPRWPNVSKGKSADQSSISEWSHAPTTQEDAARAVSGLFTGRYSFCTAKEVKPWWSVDLGSPHMIYEIRIFNRLDNRSAAGRFREFALSASTDGHVWRVVHEARGNHVWGGVDGAPFVFRAVEGVACRYIRITLLATDFLHLDQVAAYGVKTSVET